jgi:hypothetical protein
MRTHITIVGVLNILWNFLGVATGVLIVVLGLGGGSALGLAAGTEDPAAGAAILTFLAGFGVIVGCLALLPSLPGFVAGIAVLGYRNWARVILIIVSAINLLAFPLGTLLGGYSLYVLLHRETEQIFAQPTVDPDPIY